MRKAPLGYPNPIDENPIISGHDICFDKTGQGGSTSKHETRSVKTVQNTEESILTLHRKKLSVKTLFLFLHILPSWLRVVLIIQSRVPFLYKGSYHMVFKERNPLHNAETIRVPNTSSLKTGSGATEGVLD